MTTHRTPTPGVDARVDRRAACEGMWALFDSTTPEDHREAAAICATCPVRIACAERLRDELAMSRGLRSGGGGPRGTWCGRLYGRPSIHRSRVGL